ncbi:MAG: arginase family protein [Elusimicrobia bacterium]|nr:arginase family protein [Elusimicrobiota bacterium]
MTRRPLSLFGVPSSAGCLDSGTELIPGHLRKYGLVDRLSDSGFDVRDLGDVSLPPLPRHNEPPIRNFPSPRTVWERTADFVSTLDLSNGLPFCLGGDCSIIVGTAGGLLRRFEPGELHVLYIDGDVDSIAPDPKTCSGSAGMGLWLLTQPSPYWSGARLSPAHVTVLGAKRSPTTDVGIPCVLLDTLRVKGPAEAARDALADVPTSKRLLVHLDVDVLRASDMPAAYAPRDAGLSYVELVALLRPILADPRVVLLELAEFMPQKDQGGAVARRLIGALAESLRETARA